MEMKRYDHIDEIGLLELTHGEWVRFEDAQASIKAAVEAEREACAVLANETVCDVHIPTGIQIYGQVAARAIRARGAEPEQ